MRATFVSSVIALISTLCAGDVLAAEEIKEFRGQVRNALQESLRVSTENREVIVHRLVDLYSQVATNHAVSERERQQMQAQIASRLKRVSVIISRQMAIEATRRDAEPAVNADAPTDAKLAGAAKMPRDREILAQQFVAPRRPLAGAFLNGAVGPRAGFAQGARAGFGANGPIAAAQPPDNGQALVDLIQRTIEPPSWDVNGGPGSIVYFAPSRVLVVRQRSEIHQQLQDVVPGLRQ